MCGRGQQSGSCRAVAQQWGSRRKERACIRRRGERHWCPSSVYTARAHLVSRPSQEFIRVKVQGVVRASIEVHASLQRRVIRLLDLLLPANVAAQRVKTRLTQAYSLGCTTRLQTTFANDLNGVNDYSKSSRAGKSPIPDQDSDSSIRKPVRIGIPHSSVGQFLPGTCTLVTC